MILAPVWPLLLAALSPAQSAEPAATARRPVVPGTIAIRREADARLAAARAPYETAIEDALTDAGFTVIPGADNALYAVAMTVTQESKGAVVTRGRGGASVAQTGGPGFGGAGMMIGLPNRNPTIGESVSTVLSLDITRRGDPAPAWRGSAVTQQVAGSRAGAADMIAEKLAGALVRNLRQPSGLTVSVP